MTCLGNDTHLYSCQNQTKGLLKQVLRNLFCSYRLTEAHGKWRCADANITNDRAHDGHQIPAWWVTRSTLTLFMDNSGVFILGGSKAYKAFPPKWSGRCGLSYGAPAVTRYPTLYASQITNASSLIHKVAPHHRQPTHLSQHQFNKDPLSKSGNFPPRRNNSTKHFRSNRTRIRCHGVDLEAHQLRVSSLLSALQSRRLDARAAQQGRARTIIGKRRCLYVTQKKLCFVRAVCRSLATIYIEGVNYHLIGRTYSQAWETGSVPMGPCVWICSSLLIRPCPDLCFHSQTSSSPSLLFTAGRWAACL